LALLRDAAEHVGSSTQWICDVIGHLALGAEAQVFAFSTEEWTSNISDSVTTAEAVVEPPHF
jgi:hypothetical protein